VRWDGLGAVRLLAEDSERRALLVERCMPGTQLWQIEDDAEATALAAGVLRCLRRTPSESDPFELLAAAAARWQETLPRAWEEAGRPCERVLVDAAVDACRELGPEARQPSLLHQDLHGGNVLLSERGWLAIDPKPLAGDAAFDAASLLRDRRWLLGRPDDAARIVRRLDMLAEALALERERLRLWGIVHALVWGMSPGRTERDMVHCAELLHAARR
jgi:streptomycin 6-kinase